jgi:hypothetical protein
VPDANGPTSQQCELLIVSPAAPCDAEINVLPERQNSPRNVYRQDWSGNQHRHLAGRIYEELFRVYTFPVVTPQMRGRARRNQTSAGGRE